MSWTFPEEQVLGSENGQENAQLLSDVNMMQELIDACDGLKIIQNLCKNEIIEFIFYISTIDVI